MIRRRPLNLRNSNLFRKNCNIETTRNLKNKQEKTLNYFNTANVYAPGTFVPYARRRTLITRTNQPQLNYAQQNLTNYLPERRPRINTPPKLMIEHINYTPPPAATSACKKRVAKKTYITRRHYMDNWSIFHARRDVRAPRIPSYVRIYRARGEGEKNSDFGPFVGPPTKWNLRLTTA